jgi:hypothetical protein
MDELEYSQQRVGEVGAASVNSKKRQCIVYTPSIGPSMGARAREARLKNKK